MLKKMEQAKKKAEAVVNTVDISEREKMAQLKRCQLVFRGRESSLQLLIVPHAVLFCSQYLQESGRREGEERSNIRCDQKRCGQKSEPAPWCQRSLQGGGQSPEERHAGNEAERTARKRWQRETIKGWQRKPKDRKRKKIEKWIDW